MTIEAPITKVRLPRAQTLPLLPTDRLHWGEAGTCDHPSAALWCGAASSAEGMWQEQSPRLLSFSALASLAVPWFLKL